MIQFPITYYTFSGLVNFIPSFFLAVFVLVRNPKALVNRTFSLFCFAVAFWSFFYFLWLWETDSSLAEFYLRTCMMGVIFMPSLFTHFVTSLLHKSVRREWLWLNYGVSLFLALTVYASLYAGPASRHLVFPYWCSAGVLFPLHLAHFFVNVVYSHSLMLVDLRKATGIFRNQLLYVLIGTSIGYICGSTNYFSWYRIPIPPFLNPFICIYVVMVAYAIVRHRLLDIQVGTRRGVIAGLLDGLCIGIPIGLWLHFKLHPLVAILLAGLLMRVRPYVYAGLRSVVEGRRTEKILKEIQAFSRVRRQMRRQRRLETLSHAMTKPIGEILNLEKAAVYFYDPTQQTYLCQSLYGTNGVPDHYPKQWAKDSELVRHLSRFNAEEMELPLVEQGRFEKESLLEEEMRMLGANLVLPIASEEMLVGFLVVGTLLDGRILDDVELEELRAVADQAVDGYEKIQALDEVEQYQVFVGVRRQLEMMYHMMGVLVHDINNPMSVVQGYAMILRNALKEHLSEEQQKHLSWIESAGAKVGAILYEMSRYVVAAKGEAVVGSSVDEAIEETLEEFKQEVSFAEIELVKELAAGCQIWMPKNMTKQVMKGIVKNAYEAMKGKGRLEIRTQKNTDTVKVEIKDTGPGITPEQLSTLFEVNFPTQGDVGTGVGLYLTKLAIEAHKGRIACENELGQGAKFWIELPIFEERTIRGFHHPPR